MEAYFLTEEEVEVIAAARVYARYLREGAATAVVAIAAEQLIEAARKVGET